MNKFYLDKEFVDKYKTIDPGFGFNGLGEITYLRTYSRIKEDGTNEQWHETIERVVNGLYTMQKEHIIDHNLGWSELKAQDSAQEMYDRMFRMKFLPSGRSLWALGTNIINEKGLYAALNACSFVSTENIDKEFSKPFEYMMDLSMLGVGVGFDVRGANKLSIRQPKDEIEYIIPDTREGWVKSISLLLNAYFKAEAFPRFDYSLIRPYGTLIKTFGGKSAGSEPLQKVHEQITLLFYKKLVMSNPNAHLLTSTDIVDIMNMIGVCVVAGNVRRTAQIVFGNPQDEEYLKLKDYTWDSTSLSYKGSNAKRSAWGWTSNNSIFANVGMDYSSIAKQTSLNGEPGYFWLDNARKYGRMIDDPNYKDSRAIGSNPCGEQTLESYEMCNLVELFPTRCTDLEDFLRTIKFAYLFGKTITLGKSHWSDTNKVQLRNRRIGLSVSGIAQFLENQGINTLIEWLDLGYNTVQNYDKVYSDWLAIPTSIKTTSVKPSGTISLLAGVTPGVHFPESRYYIRRIRIAKNSDLLEPIKKANFKVEDSVDDPEMTAVVEIPVDVGKCKTINDVSIWEQLLLAEVLQAYWADNQVSCTITFKPWEKEQIKTSLDYFQYKLKAVSFLPKADKLSYAQMPYEEINEDEYKRMYSEISHLTFKNISEDSKPEIFCDNESCTFV